jgi:hypothetical protein
MVEGEAVQKATPERRKILEVRKGRVPETRILPKLREVREDMLKLCSIQRLTSHGPWLHRERCGVIRGALTLPAAAV